MSIVIILIFFATFVVVVLHYWLSRGTTLDHNTPQSQIEAAERAKQQADERAREVFRALEHTD